MTPYYQPSDTSPYPARKLYVSDQKTRERIVQLHETGLSYYEIATQLSEETERRITPNIVRGTLKVMGVKR